VPHLNSRGDVAHGAVGCGVSLNNQPVAAGGTMGWWDDDTIAFFDANNAWLASLYHVPTKAITVLPQGVTGSIGYCTGNGGAAWFLASGDANAGVWSTLGFRSQSAGLLGVGPDGAIVYKPDYQAGGPTLYREPDGRTWEVTKGSADTSGTTSSVCAVGTSQVLFLENGAASVRNLPWPLTPDRFKWMTHAAFAFGEWWLSYYDEQAGICLQPFMQPYGYSVLSKGDGWHTMRALTNTIIRVAVASSVGEPAGSVWVRDYDVVGSLVRDPWGDGEWKPVSRVDLVKLNAPVTVPTPQPKPEPEQPIPPVTEPTPVVPAEVTPVPPPSVPPRKSFWQRLIEALLALFGGK
jgi:hypothetical protein